MDTFFINQLKENNIIEIPVENKSAIFRLGNTTNHIIAKVGYNITVYDNFKKIIGEEEKIWTGISKPNEIIFIDTGVKKGYRLKIELTSIKDENNKEL